jgi:S-sulfo-L-cysteine synthase (O-acetyl-L-serine-dependent)
MLIIDAVGGTPLIEVASGASRADIRLYGKLEGNNPAGSVKDRPARAMIAGAEARGLLGPGVRLIEPTSGNTGIALAMVAAARGYAIELVMPENATVERVQVMRAYGAEVILTPAAAGMEGAIDHAREKVARGGYVMLDQFANPDCWRAHYATTGPEIWRDTTGEVTHFVSAMGTTGTIMGVSRYLKEQSAEIEIVGCQPADGAQIPGIRRWPEAYLPKIFEASRVDRILEVTAQAAEQTARTLAREQGIFVGTSSGGAVWAARQLCAELERADSAGVVVCVLCDRGDRYVTSPLYADAR